MSQRTLVTIFSIALVAALALGTLLNYSITTSLIAAAQLTGPSGPAGPQGPQGVAGADGKDGADGASGTGTPGARGPAGSPGAAGANGSDGSDGADGADAPYIVNTGPSGVTADYDEEVVTSITLPDGNWRITLALIGVTSVPSDGGAAAQTSCGINSVGLSAEIPPDGTPHDVSHSRTWDLGAGTFLVTCFAYWDMGPITADLTWTDLTVTATRLD